MGVSNQTCKVVESCVILRSFVEGEGDVVGGVAKKI